MNTSRASAVIAASFLAMASGAAAPGDGYARTHASEPSAKSKPGDRGGASFKLADIMRNMSRNSTKSRLPSFGGPGWTIRQVKRMARKRRNVARNRAAHRG